MRNRVLLLGSLIVALALVLMGCSLGPIGAARITATPTKTARPLFTATLTPTASPPVTATPLPVDTLPPPTITPLPTEPPLPTDTPLPTQTPLLPTEAPPPTDTALPPTDVPPTDTPAQATNTPKPAATNTPAPPTATPKPKVDFKVQEILAFEDGSLTKSGFRNIYITVVDAGGAPLDGIILQELNNPPLEQVTTGDKGPGWTEYTMWERAYRFKVVGNTSGDSFTSEETHVLCIACGHPVWDDLVRGGICSDEAACRAMGSMHYSYKVTFQRTW